MKRLIFCLFVLLQTTLAQAVSSENIKYVRYYNHNSRSTEIVNAVEYYAKRYFGNDKEEGTKITLSIMSQESSFRNVNGDDGTSVGYMQIQVPTCNQARKFNGIKVQLNLHSLWPNIHCGMAELHRLHSKLDGDWDRVIKAYNGGLSSVLYPRRYRKANRMTDEYLLRVRGKRHRFNSM